MAPDADWGSSCGDLLTEEILKARSALQKNLYRVLTPYS